MSASFCSVREAVTTVVLSDASLDCACAPRLAASKAAAMARRCGAGMLVEMRAAGAEARRAKAGACGAIARTWVRMVGCDFRSFLIA
ncbi:hypothetical protein THI4931_47820 [Pandoraea sputorum]|nr:hypothetical protein THI4931_47820 [Pandoraea sputorum]